MTFEGKFQEDFINYCEGRTERDPTREVCDVFGKDDSEEVCEEIEEMRDEMCNELRLARAQFRKERFMNRFKETSNTFSKSVDLLEKIKETNDQKYVDEYKDLYQNARDKNRRNAITGS